MGVGENHKQSACGFFVCTFEAISLTFEITLKLFNKYSFCVYNFPADSFQCVYDD